MAHHEELMKTLAHCAAECEMCHDACLDEDDIEMLVHCIRLNRDCAKICQVTASLLASHSPFATQMVKICEEICQSCAEECAEHEMDHCQRCAEACRQCAEACGTFAGEVHS
jgi:hypothetical protein